MTISCIITISANYHLFLNQRPCFCSISHRCHSTASCASFDFVYCLDSGSVRLAARLYDAEVNGNLDDIWTTELFLKFTTPNLKFARLGEACVLLNLQLMSVMKSKKIELAAQWWVVAPGFEKESCGLPIEVT